MSRLNEIIDAMTRREKTRAEMNKVKGQPRREAKPTEESERFRKTVRRLLDKERGA